MTNSGTRFTPSPSEVPTVPITLPSETHPVQQIALPRPPRTPWSPVALFLGGAAITGVTAWWALDTPRGQIWDQRAMAAVGVPEESADQLIRALSVVSVGMIAVALVVLCGVALMQGRWRAALASVLLVAGANVTTQVLKYGLLDRTDFNVVRDIPNTLPSGHTTVLASLAAAGVIVAPALGRTLWVSAASAAATMVGAATVMGQWHRPSDVVAGLGVCLTWAGIATWFLGPRRLAPFTTLLRYLLAGGLGAAVAAVVSVQLGLYAIGSATDTVLAAVGLLSIGAVASLLAAAVGFVLPVREER